MAGTKRIDAGSKAKDAVWIRAAGHCELCSKDLTQDRITLTSKKLGEVAHILPASPDGPRGSDGHSVESLAALTDDPGNLMLLCGSCHTSIDKTPEGFPASDLTDRHTAYLASIRFAAEDAHANPGAGLIVLGRHFTTRVRIEPSDLQKAMWRDRVEPLRPPLVVDLPELDQEGRDGRYYRHVRTILENHITRELTHARGLLGDEPWVGLAAIGDIPSLMILGQVIGDRRRRKLYSLDRHTGLRWSDPDALPQPFSVVEDQDDPVGPLALVLSISAEVPDRDVLAALPEAHIVRFAAAEPAYAYVKNEKFIGHFRDQLQRTLSDLEARSPDPINVFAAIPAALAVEFGALLSTNHRHGYRIDDRDPPTNAFRFHLSLDV